MAKPKADYNVTVVGHEPRQGMDDIDRILMEMGNPSGGGLPWVRPRPSPTYPQSQVTPANPSKPEPWTPTDWAPPAATGLAGLLKGLSAADWAKLVAALTGVAGSAFGGRGSSASSLTSGTDAAMQEVMKQMTGRLQKSEPLYESALAMANGLLPTQYQRAGTPAPVSGTGLGPRLPRRPAEDL